MSVSISISTVLMIPLILSVILHTRSATGLDAYDGHYDLRARDAAYLCVLMEDYLKTGKQPSLNKTSPDKLDKEMITKGKPCWRFNWKPCDHATYEHTAQRPCGWYQMENAPDEECN